MSQTILIVDDDEDFVTALATVLEEAGFQIKAAHSGVEGVAKARTETPDIIVLDVTMESAGAGFTAARELRKDETTRQIPLIMLTAINQGDAGLRYGADDDWNPVDVFLDKPVTGDQVLAEIRKILPPES